MVTNKFEITYEQNHSQTVNENFEPDEPHFSAQDYNFPEIYVAIVVALDTFIFKLVKFRNKFVVFALLEDIGVSIDDQFQHGFTKTKFILDLSPF